MSLFNPYFYVQYLALDAAAILRGQVWRIVTFLVCPPQSGVLFALLAMYLYYSIGSTLERVWGTFRFNMFFFMGVLGHIIAAFLVYGVTGFSVPMSTYYLNESLFLAFACTFPEMQFLLIFIPIRRAGTYRVFWTEKCGKIESGQCGDRAGAGDRVGHPGNDDRSGL